MKKEEEKKGFWARKRSAIPFLVIGTMIVLVLFLNEETSVKTNVEYEKRINTLKTQIQHNLDSAKYYKEHRMAIENGKGDLERIARERYHMQKPTEDIYVYEE